MERKPQIASGEPTNETASPPYKQCAYSKERKPIAEFLRRTGRRSGTASRRGACRACRNRRKETRTPHASERQTLPEPLLPEAPRSAAAAAARAPEQAKAKPPIAPKRRKKRASPPVSAAVGLPAPAKAKRPDPPERRSKRALPARAPQPESTDVSLLVPDRQGVIRMRGSTDKGRRWQQETDLETAVTLVRESAAVVVNRHTIRRLYSNKAFREHILTRDQYTCYFCGEYGDTIDHLLPRAKGGHTTPVNCVCACNLCNQSKADRSLDEFIHRVSRLTKERHG